MFDGANTTIKFINDNVDGAVTIVHAALWPHYPNKNVFYDRRNRPYGKSASLEMWRLNCSIYGAVYLLVPGPAAAKALSPKVLWVRVTTHVRLSVKRSHERALATRRQSSAKYDPEFPDSD